MALRGTVKAECMITVNGVNYYGGQEIDLSDKEFDSHKGKIHVSNTSPKVKIKKSSTTSNKETT